MLLASCGWHRSYRGWSKFMGVRSWRPLWPIQWTTGMCDACAEKFRAINGLKKNRSA